MIGVKVFSKSDLSTDVALAGRAGLSDVTCMEQTLSLVVYSDLDGTLLDHETYSWEAARPALDRLERLKVPVVLASSKTAQEISQIQIEMGLMVFPAIVENGAGVLYPGESETRDVNVYDQVRDALNNVSGGLRACFRGFGDMTNGEVAQVTGLSSTQAAFAKQRQFSEPGLWEGSLEERDVFVAALGKLGIAAREGGRFMTLSLGKTKKDRMDEINARLQPHVTIALGDAPNDIEMLEHADAGFIICNPHRRALPDLEGEKTGKIVRSAASGPAGWNLCVNGFLDSMRMQRGVLGNG